MDISRQGTNDFDNRFPRKFHNLNVYTEWTSRDLEQVTASKDGMQGFLKSNIFVVVNLTSSAAQLTMKYHKVNGRDDNYDYM